MTLNLQQRFLLLFADYRDAIEGQQRANDQILILRSQLEELRDKHEKVLAQSADAQKDLNERLMRRLFGDRVVDPSAAKFHVEPAKAGEEDPVTWQKNKWKKFEEDLRKRQSLTINGSESAPTN